MQNQKNEEKKKKQQKAVLITTIVTSVVIIAGLVMAIVLLLNQEPELMPGPAIGEYDRFRGGRGTVVTEENVEEIREWLAQPIEDARYTVSMTPDWTFPTSRAVSADAFVQNVETNTRAVFFELYLEDIGEVVYVSPIIPLGASLTDIALDADLEAGEYTALMTFFLVDDENEVVTTVAVSRPFTILA